jgi:hypothetical protein
VLFGAKQVTDGFEITAKEDLDKDMALSAKDDLLFTLTVAGKIATLRGAGVNDYYKSSWVYTPPEKRRDEGYYRSHYHGPHFHYWYWGRGWGGYYTPTSRYSGMRRDRDAYRRTSGFQSQVKNNVGYESRMSKQYGAGFRKSVTKPSPVRSAYVAKAKTSGNLKTTMKASKSSSGWGVRSQMGTASSFSDANSRTSAKPKSSTARTSTRTSSRSSSRGYGGFRGSSGCRV